MTNRLTAASEAFMLCISRTIVQFASTPRPLRGLHFLFVAAVTAPVLVAVNSAFAAGNWPHWRGPTGNGVSPDADPPLQWSPTSGVAWKVVIPGRGSASPVVWGNQIFIATAVRVDTGTDGGDKPSEENKDKEADKDKGTDKDGGRRGGRNRDANLVPHRFVLMALDRASGKILWDRVAVEATPSEGHHADHGFASASPFTDGDRVYAHFGSRGLFAFTLAGEPVWKRTDFGTMKTRGTFGEGSSPTLHGDSIIVPWDHEGPSYLTAIDRRTGKTLWKKDRDESSNWGTPLVVEHAGKKQVITTGEKFARGYDLTSGEELWRCTGQTGRPVASPVAGHGVAIIASGYRGAYLGAFRLDGKGDLKDTESVAWSLSRHTPDIPSPLLLGTRVYFLAGRNGVLSCHDVATGKAHYSAQRVEGLGNIYASPVAAAGRIYFTARDGVTVAIADGDELKVLATSSVGEPVDATPALAGKEIFIRGEKHLFAIRG